MRELATVVALGTFSILPSLASAQMQAYGDWHALSGSRLCTIWTDDRDGNGASLTYLTQAAAPRTAFISNDAWNGRPPLFWSADGTSPVQVAFTRLDSDEYIAIRIDDKVFFGNTVKEATLGLLTIALLGESAWKGHVRFLDPNGGIIGDFSAEGFSEAQSEFETCSLNLQ